MDFREDLTEVYDGKVSLAVGAEALIRAVCCPLLVTPRTARVLQL